jgi:hypothetical protein
MYLWEMTLPNPQRRRLIRCALICLFIFMPLMGGRRAIPVMAGPTTGAGVVHWAYQPIRRPPVPEVKDAHWPRNPIDRFILARLEREGLKPAAVASPQVLLRRMTYDLTGLPPTPADVKAVDQHSDAVAWKTRADRMLASQAYGEQWARHWMDVARYADSAGYELDYSFTESWKYRDWLIRSFQSNKPLDRFIQEQIAGDQLWPDSQDAADAALFLTIGPRRHEGGIQRAAEREYEWFTDLTDTTGSVFLGSTLACTRCHDHKFDPFTQRDYYGMQAIFADSQLDEKHIGNGDNASQPASLRVAPREKPANVHILRRGELESPLAEAPPALPAILPGGGELTSSSITPTPVLRYSEEPDRTPKNPALRSTSEPASSANTPTTKPLANTGSPHRRAILANWLTSKDNPLVARVLVNRIWQWHFGAGLVRTPSDFGRQGEPPTHPELLDWLASELISSGWDLRHLHKLILESATYRMASTVDPEVMAHDPDGRLFTHFPRRRLNAEELRDAMFAVAGDLNPKAFGPPVVPPVEASELSGLSNKHWDVTPDASEHRRRSVYLVVRRSIKPAFFDAFNAPDTISSCAMRDRSVVPSQALTLLNSNDALSRARALAARLWRDSDGDPSRAAETAWLLLFGRPITADERQAAVQFLADRQRDWQRHAGVADRAPRGAWVEWCLALLNANEFIYVD